MTRFNASTVFGMAMMLTVLVLAGTTYMFFNQMSSNYILIQDGNTPIQKVLNPYKFVQNKKGLIFSLTFLLSGLSFGIMVLLPSSEQELATKRALEAANRARGGDKPQPDSGGYSEQSMTDQDEVVNEAQEPLIPGALSEKEQKKEVMIEELDLLDGDDEFSDGAWTEITEGEDDVVYGTEQITSAAVMDFVHKFPDSALKFLYRKQLNGKPLSKEEEEIYAAWEKRGMSRPKVKHYILSLMEWEKLPRDPLYEIWKRLRDHIFDTIN